MWNFHSYPWCQLPVCLGLAYELHALPVMWPVKSWWGRGRDVVGRRMASWWNIGGCGFLLVDRVTNWTGFIIYLCWEQTSFGNLVFHLILINRVGPILCEVGDPKGELPVCVVTHHSHTYIYILVSLIRHEILSLKKFPRPRCRMPWWPPDFKVGREESEASVSL